MHAALARAHCEKRRTYVRTTYHVRTYASSTVSRHFGAETKRYQMPIKLLHIQFNGLNRYVFITTWAISTQPHLNVIPSGEGKLFHEPRRIVEGTAGVQSTTALPIPEGVIGIEYVLEVIFTGSITEVVTPHIGWEGDGHRVVDVGAGTDSIGMSGEDLVNSNYKSPDMLPGIVSVCEANAIHIIVINCETTINVIRMESIRCLLLVANDLATHVCVYRMP